MSLKDKIVLVTGAATGIGAATAIRAAEAGARVVVNYNSSADAAQAIAEAIASRGSEVLLRQADVSDGAAARGLIASVEEAWGGIDVLVNNAGYTAFVDFADLDGLTDEIWRRTLQVNLMGTWYVSRAVAGGMTARGEGAIVNVSSVGALTASGSSIAYVVSKAAILSLTKAMARTLAPAVRVNAVAAGYVDTPWWVRHGYGDRTRVANLAASIVDQTPLHRAGRPEDIADAILWLAGRAGLTTGETITVDAGMHLGNPVVSGRR